MSQLLPVGSIVSVDDNKRIEMMIIGYYPADAEKKECYEYLGAAYPSGVSVNGALHMFNHKDIRKVVFEGYATDASRKALDDLTAHAERVLNGDPPENASPVEEDLFF